MPPPPSPLRSRISALIERLEKHAQTDLRYIARGGFWLTTSNATIALTAFISSIAFGYFVPKDVFGMYQYMLTILGILTIATLPKVNDAMSQAVARGIEGELRKAFRVRTRWGVLASLGALGIATYYYLNSNILLSETFAIVALFVWCFDALGMYVTYLKAKKLFREASMYKVIFRVAGLLCMIGVIWWTQNLWAIVFAYFAIYGGIHVLSGIRTLRQYPPNELQDPDAIRYGKSLSFLGAFKAIVMQLDKVLVFHYLGAAELAVYFFATAPVDQLRSMLSALAELALPKFSQAREAALRSTLIRKLLRFEFAILLPITVVYIVCIPYVFPLVFPAYRESVPFTEIYALSIIFFPTLLLSTALLAQKKERAIWLTRIVSPIIRLAVLIPAVQWWGLWGMTIGVVVVYALDLALNLAAFWWSTHQRPLPDEPSHR